MVLYCISLQDALRAKNGDLSAFLARVKQQLDNDKDTESSKNIINLEYLKNCICRFMSSRELSEKARLVPVIATILQFTDRERNTVMEVVQSDMRAGPAIQSRGRGGADESVTALFSSMFGHA